MTRLLLKLAATILLLSILGMADGNWPGDEQRYYQDADSNAECGQ